MKPLIPYFYYHWIVVIVLSFVTFFVFTNIERYNVVGSNLLSNKFEQKVLCTIQPCTDGAIKVTHIETLEFWLNSKSGKGIISISQTLPVNEPNQVFLFSALLKVNQVEKGERRWQTAHLVAIGIDKNGIRLFHEPHFLSRNTGTSEWQNYTKIIRLGDAAVEFLVEAQLSKVKGSVNIKDIELYALDENTDYQIYWYIAVTAWFLVFAWGLITFYRVNGFANLKKSVVILLVIIIVGAVIPQAVTEAIYNKIDSLVFLIFDITLLLAEGDETYSAKYVHFWVFALLALFVFKRCRSYKSALSTMALLLSLAIVIEVVQLLIDERNTELNDLILDSAGIVVGGALSFIWLQSMSFLKK